MRVSELFDQLNGGIGACQVIPQVSNERATWVNVPSRRTRLRSTEGQDAENQPQRAQRAEYRRAGAAARHWIMRSRHGTWVLLRVDVTDGRRMQIDQPTNCGVIRRRGVTGHQFSAARDGVWSR